MVGGVGLDVELKSRPGCMASDSSLSPLDLTLLLIKGG